MGCITPKNNGNIRFCTRTHLSLYHIQYKRVSKETRKSLCYGGLLRTGWYVRNRVYVYSSDRGGDGQEIYACYVSSAKCAAVFKLF